MLKPRYYQENAITAIYKHFENEESNPLVAMPTGTGKALVIALFIQSVFFQFRGQCILVLTHVEELIQQNFDELAGIWATAPAGIYSAGLKRREIRPITFAGIDSVVNIAEEFGTIDLVIIDECHLVGPDEESNYRKFIADLTAITPDLRIIGLTATPYRVGQGLLTEPSKDGTPSIWGKICYDITGKDDFNQLIEEGFLCPLIPQPTDTTIDLSGVKMAATGDYNQAQLQAASDRDEVTFAAVKEMIEKGADRNSWLVFAAGVRHAEHVCEMLESQGIPACVVHSKMKKALRKENTAKFKSGEYRALVNNGVFTTGFNHRPIDLIGMLRATESPGLWVQMLGRGTRPSPETMKENCLVLDFAENTRRLGPINDPLLPRPRGKGKGEGPQQAPVKLCPTCSTYNHASARLCISCKGEFPAGPVKLCARSSTEELIARSVAPVVEILEVKNVAYTEYQKPGKPPMIRVTYKCGFAYFNEFVCFEHLGFARKKAIDWWRLRAGKDAIAPQTTAQAMAMLQRLPLATHLRVVTNTKYPEIKGCCLDGSAFGTKKPGGVAPVLLDPDRRYAPQESSTWNTAEDDIPF